MVLHDMDSADGRRRNEVHDEQALGSRAVTLAQLTVQEGRLVPERPFKPVEGFLSPEGRKVYGKCVLPAGYQLTLLPPGTRLCEMDGTDVFQPDDRRSRTKSSSWIQQRPKAIKRE